jgi:dihydrofolate reductase
MLISHNFMTLDGVAAPDAVMDTIAAMRQDRVILDDFFGRVAKEDAMLLGRVTYEEWAGYWPTSDIQPFADHINAVPKYVVSRTLSSAPWPGGDATVLDELEAVRALEGTVGVHGSLTLVEALLHADLLDELRLEVYPVIAGSGARLFGDGRAPKRLRLAESKIAPNGVAILVYRRA